MPDTGKKSKWGLGGMLHKDRPNASTDSTYGSDIDSSARDSYGSGSAPSLTNSEPSLQPNQHINNQGQVVTTTTTTTTTITTGAGGQSETSGPHSSNLANKMDPRVNSSSDQTEVSEVSHRRENERPSIPQKSVRREPSPQPPPQQQHSGTGGGLSSILTGGRSQRDRSPNYEETSSPTGRHNFSYPSRAPPNGNGQVQSGPMPGGSVQGGQMAGGQHQPSTLQNLKTAAVGIHVSSPSFLISVRYQFIMTLITHVCLTGRRRNPPRHVQLWPRQAHWCTSRANGRAQPNHQLRQTGNRARAVERC